MYHNIFNNQSRSGYNELCSYSPLFYKSIKEMDLNFMFAGGTLDTAAESLESTIDNQFISTSDEETITRIENWLGIDIDLEKSLEDRRKKVLLVWNGGEKLTGTFIKNMIKSYSGVTDEPSVKMDTSLVIRIPLNSSQTLDLDDLIAQIESMKPAHISLDIDLMYEQHQTLKQYTNEEMAMFTHEQIKNKEVYA